MDSNGHILPVFNCSGDTKNLEYHNKNFSEWPAIGHLGKKKKVQTDSTGSGQFAGNVSTKRS